MAEVAPAPPAAAPAKASKKKQISKSKRVGPSVGELIVKAISASKERSGVSLAALKKALVASGYDVEKNNSRVKVAVKSLVTKGVLLQTKGTGASGSFKLNKNHPLEKKVAPKIKKPAAAKKPVAKKAAAKKSPKKPATPKAKKSPKKAKKAAAAKKPTKSPKKVKKPAAAAKVTKSPKKTKAAKPKVAKPKSTKAKKVSPRKK
ncbi:histone H1-like [Conger conger]|uniref:histone H1-like n=1 Tax=Conger conger TaxID=82655 RepID=UPI002A5AEE1D|nr:histone H1-like [Conger conger]